MSRTARPFTATASAGRFVLALAALATLVVVAGCSTTGVTVERGSGSSSPIGSPSGAIPDPAAPGWAGLLARVPDFATTGATSATVTMVDLRKAREHVGLDPTDVRLGGKIGDLLRLQANPLPSTWAAIEPKKWQEKLGFLPYTADRAYEIDMPGTSSLTILEGAFDATRITETVRGSGALGSNPATVSHGGTTYLQAPGEELKVSADARKTGIDHLGRPLRMHVSPTVIVVATTDAGMRAAIDARAGIGAASSRPAAATVAKALDEVGALAAVSSSSNESFDRGPSGSAQGTTTVVRSGATADSTFVGTRLDGATAGAFLVALKATPGDAEEAANNLRTLVETGEALATGQPWREQLTPIAIDTDGPLVRATFNAKIPNVLVQSMFKRESITDL